LKTPEFLKGNLLLKMTSLNAVVIIIRLFIGFFIQRELTQYLGKGGYAKVGSLRNLMGILTSTTSLGTFNGIVKYVAEHKENKPELQKLFSTSLVFTVIGSFVSFLVLFLCSEWISDYFFYTHEYAYVIKVIAVLVPVIAIKRVFDGIINGLSLYKKFAKIELLAYLISAAMMILFLYRYNLEGSLFAIALVPVVQVIIMSFVLSKIIKSYVELSGLKFRAPLAKNLLAFTLMSFVSSILFNYLEVDIRGMIESKVSESDAGIWTGMTTLSKNYMVFSNAIFTLYVIPKFSGIHTKSDFIKELMTIYKTLMPLFALGMLIIYFLKQLFVDYIFLGFDEMIPLFKWQLIGDFIRLAALVLAHQFLAKKLVRSFIFTELLSLGLFFVFSYYLVDLYGVEGVPMAHLLRYIIYFIAVLIIVMRYFKKANVNKEKEIM